MKKFVAALALLCLTILSPAAPKTSPFEERFGTSLIAERPDDPSAVYFTPDAFGFTPGTDVTDALQTALNEAKRKENGCGILFVPEGTYKLSRTVYIPSCVRLIGYGSKRPLFVLEDKAPDFQEADPVFPKGKYLFWFIGGGYSAGRRPSDANSGTFYSSIINVDISLGKGNPAATAIRAHFAQHCSISSVNISVGSGRAGIVDAGNHIENVAISGGEYGIDTDKASPGWPIMLLNTRFEGQRTAAIRSNEGGLTIVRALIRNTPIAVEVTPDAADHLYMEDCIIENVSDAALKADTGNPALQLNLRDIRCSKVPVFARNSEGVATRNGEGKLYKLKSLTCGYNQESLEDQPEATFIHAIEPLKELGTLDASGTPLLPRGWVNIRELGAVGDGFTDDTEVFKKAIENHRNIYIPQGWYVVKEALELKEDTNIIGLHPGTTIILCLGGNPAFSGFGAPVAQLTTPKGGRNLVCGIFLNADAYNYRAVNCKWMAGEGSYMYDVKFSGHDKDSFRHGRQSASNPLENPMEPDLQTQDLKSRAWDNQHWSLWITDGGGGTFRDIWTANEYSSAGLYVSHTSTPGYIYGMSLEHHLRNEAIFRNVSNWKIYDFQFEEEAEGIDTQQLELSGCSNLTFANIYGYRVSRLVKSYPSAIRTWDCKDIEFLNVHNYAHFRIKFTTDASLLDMASGREVRSWELARLVLKGDESRRSTTLDGFNVLASGLEFPDGLSSDGKGNIYFCEFRMRRIYKLDTEGRLSTVADLPWNPVALGCDTDGKLLVVTKYIAQPGYRNDDSRDSNRPLFGWRGSGGLWGFTYVPRIYSIDPDRPEDSFTVLPLVPVGDASGTRLLYPANRSSSYGEFKGGKGPERAFTALDGVTSIPYYEDLFRCSALIEVKAGESFVSIDEYNGKAYRSSTDAGGKISGSSLIAARADRGVCEDGEGRVYVADGNISIYDAGGKLLRRLEVPERPTSLLVSGGRLYVTTVSSLLEIPIDSLESVLK